MSRTFKRGRTALFLIFVVFLAASGTLSFLLLPSSAAQWAPRRADAAAAAPRALDILRASIGGPVARPNPWRDAVVRGRVDWHDLVTVPSPPKGSPGEALARHLREDAKDALLRLLQNVGRYPSGSAGRAASVQDRLLTELRRAGGRAPILELVLSRDAVARAADTAALDADDLSALRATADDGEDERRGCTLVRDTCLLHSTLRACLHDSFCGWCAANSVCLTRGVSPVPCAPTAQSSQRANSSAGSSAARHVDVRGVSLDLLKGALVVATDTVPTDPIPKGATSLARDGDLQPSTNCSLIVREHPIFVAITGNAAMAYHLFTETLPGWVSAAASSPQGARGLSTTVLVRGAWNELLSFSSLFSRSCTRSVSNAEVTQGACFLRASSSRKLSSLRLSVVNAATGRPLAHLDADVSATLLEPVEVSVRAGMRLNVNEMEAALEAVAAGGAPGSAWLSSIASEALPPAEELASTARSVLTRLRALATESFSGLAAFVCGAYWEEDPSRDERPLVVFVSRLNKRLIFNEPEIVRVALALGADVRIAALETLSVCAQVRLFARASVLVGMHGSALINTFFMRPGSALLQIVPHRVEGASTFFEGPAIAHGVRYSEMAVDKRADTITHDHFLQPNVRADDLFAKGSRASDQKTWFSFWIVRSRNYARGHRAAIY
jgi:hypothetical protein